jgi:hypothetical protein
MDRLPVYASVLHDLGMDHEFMPVHPIRVAPLSPAGSVWFIEGWQLRVLG